MGDVEISRLIEVILTTNNNELRKTSEANLNQIKTANPGAYIITLVSLMKGKKAEYNKRIYGKNHFFHFYYMKKEKKHLSLA